MSLTEDHEIPLELMRHRPEAVAELARALFGLDVPDGPVHPAPEAATDVKVKDWRKDSLYLVGDEPERLGLVLEVQREWDKEKLYSWLVYLATARARFHCEAAVLVLCKTKALAKRYARPIKIGPRNHYRVLTFTLRDLRPITDPDRANRNPELATLAMLGTAPDAAREAAAHIWYEAVKNHVADDDAKSLYYDFVVNHATAGLRRYLEDMMTTMEHRYSRTKSKFGAGYYAKGKAEGEALALLTVLDGRGITLSDEQRERIQACTDLDRLQGWLKVAGTIVRADELFD